MRSLVADSARFQRRILLLLLEGLGISGAEAESFGAAREAGADLMFLDLSILPPAPPAGWRAGDPPERRVVVTGEAVKDDSIAAWITSGADGFLLKPFTRDGLARVLEDLDMAS